MKAALTVLVGSALVVAACGSGNDSSTYAGMNRYEATDQALGAVSDEAKKPHSIFHGRRATFVKSVRGRNAEGADAWIAEVKLGGRFPICIWIWVDKKILSTRYTYDYGPCPAKVLRAKPQALVS